MAQHSESVASLLELVSPREPEHVLFGELLLYKGWGSWVATNCTLLKLTPYGSDAEWTFCYALPQGGNKVAVIGQPTKEADRSNQIGPGADGEGQHGVKGDVLNIFHHQLAEVAVIKRKKFEFSIRTHYDEFDPMARPEELLKLRAKTQAEFEQWVDALTTWSQGLQSMSLLKF